MELLEREMMPSKAVKAWLEENTDLVNYDQAPMLIFRGTMKLKLLHQTDNIRLHRVGKDYMIQIEDNEPETLSKEEFIEKYVKPSTLYFSPDFKKVIGTEEMVRKFVEYCHNRFGDDLR